MCSDKKSASRWEYWYSDWTWTFGWMCVILTGGVSLGLWLAAPGALFWLLPTLGLPAFCILLLYREVGVVDAETGEIELSKGVWPWLTRRRLARGEARWIYLSGAGSNLTSTVTMGIEDRSGNRHRLCVEGQECVDEIEEEAEELARALGVIVYASPTFHDARRRIYSGRRDRWRAGLELGLAGVMTIVLAMLARSGRLSWPGSPEAGAVLLLCTFAAISFVIIGIGLALENRTPGHRA